MREEIITGNLRYEFKKHLQDNEIICPYCKGTGLDVADNIYGIQGDKTHIGVRFPFKNQSFKFCPYCFNGVLKKCKYCGSILTKAHFKCCCEEAQKEEKDKLEQAHITLYNQSEHISWDEACKKYDCFYCENFDIFFDDEDELLYELKEFYDNDNLNINEIIPILRCYVCDTTCASIPDAYQILETALELGDCYETEPDEYDVKELQKVINDFFNNRKIGTTYVPNYGVGIIFNMEDFK